MLNSCAVIFIAWMIMDTSEVNLCEALAVALMILQIAFLSFYFSGIHIWL